MARALLDSGLCNGVLLCCTKRCSLHQHSTLSIHNSALVLLLLARLRASFHVDALMMFDRRAVSLFLSFCCLQLMAGCLIIEDCAWIRVHLVIRVVSVFDSDRWWSMIAKDRWGRSSHRDQWPTARDRLESKRKEGLRRIDSLRSAFDSFRYVIDQIAKSRFALIEKERDFAMRDRSLSCVTDRSLLIGNIPFAPIRFKHSVNFDYD